MAEIKLATADFKALSSEKRTSILRLLKDRRHNLTELAAKLQVSKPSVKEHLEVLEAAGLIEQVDGDIERKWKYYGLTSKGKKLIASTQEGTFVLIVMSLAAVAVVGLLFLLATALLQPVGMQRAAVGEVAETAKTMQAVPAPLPEPAPLAPQAPSTAPQPLPETAAKKAAAPADTNRLDTNSLAK